MQNYLFKLPAKHPTPPCPCCLSLLQMHFYHLNSVSESAPLMQVLGGVLICSDASCCSSGSEGGELGVRFSGLKTKQEVAGWLNYYSISRGTGKQFMMELVLLEYIHYLLDHKLFLEELFSLSTCWCKIQSNKYICGERNWVGEPDNNAHRLSWGFLVQCKKLLLPVENK